MKIIDAHAHIAKPIAGYCRRGELRAIGGGKARWANGDVMKLIPDGYGDMDFTAESALRMMDENHVEKTVLVQGSMYGFQNEYTAEAVAKYPNRFTGACTVDPFAKNCMETLNRLTEELHFHSIKFEASSGGGLMGFHNDFALDGPEMTKIYDVIAKKSMTLVLDIGDHTMESYQPMAVANIAKRYPGLRIVVCHLLAPLPKCELVLEQGLKKLKYDNVWFDTAALPNIAAPEVYPYPTSLNAIRMAKEIVGAKHLMWGTDMPMTVTMDSYRHLMDYISTQNIFTDSELEDFYYNNAQEVYFNF